MLWSFSKHFINTKYKKLSGYLNRYLHWYAIKKFKSENFKIYDFGGINLDRNSETYGITKFKLSFGGEIIKQYDYILHKIPHLKYFYKFF
jgi:lipid II:glycine glycyltransferase (peptidoglycan interpeptide bridge formation enzyme)